MRTFLLGLFFMAMLLSCGKEKVQPAEPLLPSMRYIDLRDTSVVFQRGASFDLDSNGQKDIYFSTQLVGDPVYQQDKKQWLVSSSFYANLPVNSEESIPQLLYNSLIPLGSFSGYNWYNASTVILAQQIISNSAPPVWVGDWKNAAHQYIPIQIMKSGGVYTGWVEISFDTAAGKTIVHKAGLSLQPNQAVRAGK